MNVTKAFALLTLTMFFWLSAAEAHEVVGESPRLSGFFAKQRECSDAAMDAKTKADKLCKKLRHRGFDKQSLRFSPCWGQFSSKRTIKLNFKCE